MIGSCLDMKSYPKSARKRSVMEKTVSGGALMPKTGFFLNITFLNKRKLKQSPCYLIATTARNPCI